METADKDLAYFWYYTIKELFPKEDIDNDDELCKNFLFIKNHIRKKYGSIENLTRKKIVELRLNIPHDCYNIDYREIIERNQLRTFERYYDQQSEQFYESNIHDIPKEFYKIYLKPDVCYIGKLYQVHFDGIIDGGEEARSVVKDIESLMELVMPDFDQNLNDFINNIKNPEKVDNPTNNSDEEESSRQTKLRECSIVFYLKRNDNTLFVRFISPKIDKGSLMYPHEAGLYKNKTEPTVICEMLLWFATKGKTLNPYDYKNQITGNTFSQRINRTNKWLKEKFELSENPISKYSRARSGYTIRISVTYDMSSGGPDALDLIDDRADNIEFTDDSKPVKEKRYDFSNYYSENDNEIGF